MNGHTEALESPSHGKLFPLRVHGRLHFSILSPQEVTLLRAHPLVQLSGDDSWIKNIVSFLKASQTNLGPLDNQQRNTT